MRAIPVAAPVGLLLCGAADRGLLAEFFSEMGHETLAPRPEACDVNALARAALIIVDEECIRVHHAALLALKARLQPVILPILVALSHGADGTTWLRKGFDDLLRWPFAKDDLLARTEAFLRLRRQSEDALRASESFSRATLDAIAANICVVDSVGKILMVNRAWREFALANGAEPTATCENADYLEVCRRAGQSEEELAAVILGRRASISFEYACHSPEQERWFSAQAIRYDSAGGEFTVIAHQDISERKASELALLASQQALRASASQLEVHALRQERIARFGEFALKRRSADELSREALRVLREQADVAALFEEHPGQRILLRAALGAHAEDSVGKSAPLEPNSAKHKVLQGEHTLRLPADYFHTRSQDQPWSEWMRGMKSGAYAPVTHNGHVHGMLGIFSANAEGIRDEEVRFVEAIGHLLSTALQREQAEQRLAYLAQFDALTKLPNRSLLEDRLRQTMAQSRRRQCQAGVLFIDLDRFKLVNDTLGHHAGDQVIQEVARRLQTCLRAGDTVGRLSGDEFAVVLADLAHADDAGLVAQKILDALAMPYALEGNEVFVGASIGICVHPADGETAETLLRNADIAMYQAKEGSRNAYRYFTAGMNEHSVSQLQLGTDLRHAIERGEFELHYQPKVELRSGHIAGVEALLRWNHPQRGAVPPAQFIPVLEASGLILPVGEWVLEQACAQIRRWGAEGLAPVPIAINLSVKQFRRPNLDRMIQRTLAAAAVSAQWIELEITESSIADDPEDAVRQLSNLHRAGLKISLDDFGTGYSSLAYLTRMPLFAFKIDRSFVSRMLSDPSTLTLVQTMISLAHSLRLKVVAEGVETAEQANALRQLRCDQIQGYYFSKPLPLADVTRLLLRAGEAAAA